MSKSICITLPLPVSQLSPNVSYSGYGKARLRKKYRQYAWAVTLELLGRNPAPQWERAIVQATFYHDVERRRDGDNALASLKAAFDGIADAGVVVNDSGFRHEPVQFAIDRGNPRVEIKIRETL
jgi:Holliday junction resolvase RusA-like endonuclease